MYLVRVYSRNSGQHFILARKGTFYEKRALFIKKDTFYEKEHFLLKIRHQIFHPYYSIPFLSVLHQIKLCIISQMGAALNSETLYWMQYTMLVASNPHISTLSRPLWKNGNDWKRYVPAVPMIMSFKVFLMAKYVSFYLLARIFFPLRNLDPHNSRCFSPEKCWLLAWI